METKKGTKEEVTLTLKILLKDSHPAIAEHAGYFCKELGELILRKTGEEKLRQEVAEKLQLPKDLSFKLNILASNEGHEDRQRELARRFLEQEGKQPPKH